jgi:cell division protein ZapA (FtsZ GTPase activity inhibitor)
MTATDPSPEVITSTPITTQDKNITINVDDSNAVTFNLNGQWSLHEAIGVLVLTGVNIFTNNSQHPGLSYVANRLDQLIASLAPTQ